MDDDYYIETSTAADSLADDGLLLADDSDLLVVNQTVRRTIVREIFLVSFSTLLGTHILT